MGKARVEAVSSYISQDQFIVDQTHLAIREGDRNSWLVADNYAKLNVSGWTQEEIAFEFKSSQSSVQRFIACVTKYPLVGNRPRFWEAFSELKSPRTLGTGQDEWYTPPEYVECVRSALGNIDLDPASCSRAQEWIKADRFFTQDGDGLSLPWEGRVFLNPPYSQPKVAQFIEKLVSSYGNGVTAAVTLTTNNTDTDWFQQLAVRSRAVCLTDGRVSFIAPDGRKPSPNQGHAFCYLGDDLGRFVNAFSSVGVILYANPA